MLKNIFERKYEHLFKISQYYKQYKRLIGILVTVMLSASSLGMILPYVYSKRLIAVTDLHGAFVLYYSVLCIVIIAFHHLFWYLWEKFASILTNMVAREIRNDLIEKVLSIKYVEVTNKTSGYFLERINTDALEVASFLSNVLGILIDCFTNFSFLLLIYILNLKCGLLFTMGILLLYIVDYYRIINDLRYTEKLKMLNEEYNTKIGESIKGIRDIKGLGIKREVLHSTILLNDQISKMQIEKEKGIALLSRIRTFIQYIIEGVLIIYSVRVLIPNGQLSIVSLLMIIDYSGFMYELVGFLAKIKEHFVKGEYQAKRLLEILDNNNTDEYGNKKIHFDNYEIAVKELSFSYDDSCDVNILSNISFLIKENTASLFIGASGSGKSTLFGVLAKIISVESNKILIGQIDINEITEESFRDKMCIINQEPFLLNDTILNNIKIVKSNATLDEVITACKMANIYDEIILFQNGFDTMVVEGGNNLSGGQKQRIAIARAILRDSNIILFDEPTSAMDNENQKIFYSTIKVLKKSKTILIIDHKCSHAGVFDNIYELKNGTLIKCEA